MLVTDILVTVRDVDRQTDRQTDRGNKLCIYRQLQMHVCCHKGLGRGPNVLHQVCNNILL